MEIHPLTHWSMHTLNTEMLGQKLPVAKYFLNPRHESTWDQRFCLLRGQKKKWRVCQWLNFAALFFFFSHCCRNFVSVWLCNSGGVRLAVCLVPSCAALLNSNPCTTYPVVGGHLKAETTSMLQTITYLCANTVKQTVKNNLNHAWAPFYCIKRLCCGHIWHVMKTVSLPLFAPRWRVVKSVLKLCDVLYGSQ